MAAQDILKINMLGEFSLTYKDKTVNDQSSRSKKLWLLLLEYLITFRDREISQNDLIDLLWPEDDISNPANTLKTLLHRVRATVSELGYSDGKSLIRCRRGAYAWNTEVASIVDVDVFEQLRQEAEQEADPDHRLSLLLDAIDIYKGDFLPKAALEAWAVPISTYYHTQYIHMAHEAIDLLEAENRCDDIIAVCQKATVVDPYDEFLHRAMIQALSATGANQSAMQHYEYVTRLFYSQFGVTPSAELTALYRDIVKTTNETQTDLNIIRENLQEKTEDPSNGAFFCEYEFFKDFYQLCVRAAPRNGQIIQLALVTIVSSTGDALEPKLRNTAMERTRVIIGRTLRRGDIFARYSVTQYLLMLPSASYENGEKVLQRIARTFKRDYPKMPVTLNYTLLPIDLHL